MQIIHFLISRPIGDERVFPLKLELLDGKNLMDEYLKAIEGTVTVDCDIQKVVNLTNEVFYMDAAGFRWECGYVSNLNKAISKWTINSCSSWNCRQHKSCKVKCNFVFDNFKQFEDFVDALKKMKGGAMICMQVKLRFTGEHQCKNGKILRRFLTGLDRRQEWWMKALEHREYTTAEKFEIDTMAFIQIEEGLGTVGSHTFVPHNNTWCDRICGE